MIIKITMLVKNSRTNEYETHSLISESYNVPKVDEPRAFDSIHDAVADYHGLVGNRTVLKLSIKTIDEEDVATISFLQRENDADAAQRSMTLVLSIAEQYLQNALNI